MPDLLHRLAARTLGHGPTLTPRVPTYYEPGPDLPIVDAEATAAAPSTVEAAVRDVAASQRIAGAEAPDPARGERTVAAGHSAESEPPQTVERTVFAPRATGRPEVPAPAPLTPAESALTPRVEVVGVSAASLPPLPEPVPAPAIARRAAAAAQAQPDVHITIGRIEVRAEPAAQPAAPATRPAPSTAQRREAAEPPALSLAAYLRGDDGRPR